MVERLGYTSMRSEYLGAKLQKTIQCQFCKLNINWALNIKFQHLNS